MVSVDLTGRCIAQVLATSSGGVGTHVQSILPRLLRTGAHVRVCGPAPTEELFGWTHLGARFQQVAIGTAPRPDRDLASVLALRKALDGADVAHAHGIRAGSLTVAATSATRHASRRPVVVTLHNAVLDLPWPRRHLAELLERYVVRGADVVLAASSDLASRARKLGGRDVRLAPVSAPALPPAAKDRAVVRAELGLSERQPMILAVGRLHHQKDYPTLLSASRVWRDRPDRPMVLVAGDGPLQRDLEARAARDELPVRFLGRRSDVSDLMAACDVVALTSVWEARALVAQEAVRCGRPLVATAVGGLLDLFPDGGAGLVPARDSRAVAAAVSGLLDDPAAAAAQVRAGYEAARAWPDDEETADALASLYAELRVRPRSGP